MRKITVWTCLCILLVGSSLSRGQAQQISIAGDINSSSMLMDISLRDADLNEVLTAMFNTTGGKYQLQVGNGVVGRITRLQLIQTPFDKALDAILGTEYSYTRRQIGNGNYLYTINGRSSSSVPDTGASVPSLSPPITASSTSTGIDSATPAASAGSLTTGSSSSLSSTPPTVLTLKEKKAGTGKPGEAATDETLVVNTIKINNLDIEALCKEIGGTVVKLFVQSASSSGNGGAAAPANNNNNNNNNSGYNNNNNNNNGYNNNNNNNGYNNNGYNNGYNNNNSNYNNTGSYNNNRYNSNGYSSGNSNYNNSNSYNTNTNTNTNYNNTAGRNTITTYR